jgi:hypothetical protein
MPISATEVMKLSNYLRSVFGKHIVRITV